MIADCVGVRVCACVRGGGGGGGCYNTQDIASVLNTGVNEKDSNCIVILVAVVVAL